MLYMHTLIQILCPLSLSPWRLVLFLQGEGVLASAWQRHGGGGQFPPPHRKRLAPVHRDAVGLSGHGTQKHGDGRQRAPSLRPRRERLWGVLLHLGHGLAFRCPPLPISHVAAPTSLDALAGVPLWTAMMPKQGTEFLSWLVEGQWTLSGGTGTFCSHYIIW